MPTFANHYKSLSRPEKTKLLTKIVLETEMAPTTLQFKIYTKKVFRKLEQEKIAQILNMPREELFPEVESTTI